MTLRLPKTFCVFILTHGRPDNVRTIDTLRRAGYTGRLYLVVDDEDATVDRYRQEFGTDHVIVFDKKAEADLCDEGNNFDERRTILMARNACFSIAARLGVTHFLQLDDDYYYFGRRLEDGARIIRDFDQYPVEMLLRTDHGPEMFDNLYAIKLGKRRFGDIFIRGAFFRSIGLRRANRNCEAAA